MPTERRRLSYDEMKAAEAAFQGRGFNESWSQAARAVYDGILAASSKLKQPPEVFGAPRANSVPAETGSVRDCDQTWALASDQAHRL